MKNLKILRVQTLISILMLLLSSQACSAEQLQQQVQQKNQNYLAYPAMKSFINRMVQKGFDQNYLVQTFTHVSRDTRVLASASSPAEKKPWRNYRPIFLTEKRISTGVNFWNIHQKTLHAASQKYGIPPEYIVAVIGVETLYGRNTGKYNILRSLTTLAMDFPKRSRFYTSELEHYFQLLREEGLLNSTVLRGSYAGAMGMGQFISSSYRRYAIDFNRDGHTDLWHPEDTIGSIANYFHKHGWQHGADVAVPAHILKNGYSEIVNTKASKPLLTLSQLTQYGVQPLGKINSQHVGLLELIGSSGVEYWITGDNFYVITRYNHSPKYAMAVFQLAQEIKNRKQLQ